MTIFSPAAGDLLQELPVNLLVEIAKLPELEMRLQADAVDGRIGFLQAIQQAKQTVATRGLPRVIQLEIVFVIEQQRSRIGRPRFTES